MMCSASDGIRIRKESKEEDKKSIKNDDCGRKTVVIDCGAGKFRKEKRRKVSADQQDKINRITVDKCKRYLDYIRDIAKNIEKGETENRNVRKIL